MGELKDALTKDFNNLYVWGYTTTWEMERLKIGLEIGIMHLDNVEAFISAQVYEAVKAERERVEQYDKLISQLLEVENHADFSNGNKGVDGISDEGVYQAFNFFKGIRKEWQALKSTEEGK